MFVEGKIRSYNTDRGFGFIDILGEKKDLFFHINDMPNKHIEPKVGEQLRFSIAHDSGKLKADHIIRLDVKIEQVRHTPQSRAQISQNRVSTRVKQKEATGNFTTIIGLIIILGLGYAVYGKYLAWKNSNSPEMIEPERVVQKVPEPQFTCDGREHCSQMGSYEEAVFFIRNCPNTKMDGDRDGIPCERQHF